MSSTFTPVFKISEEDFASPGKGRWFGKGEVSTNEKRRLLHIEAYFSKCEVLLSMPKAFNF